MNPRVFYRKLGSSKKKQSHKIIQAEMKSDVLSKSTLDALQAVQKIHKEDILKIFDRNNTESDLMVFGQKFKQVLGEGGSNKAGNVKVFATEKLTEQNIRAYAESLTGGVPFTEIPNKPGRYYAKLANGSTVNLRKVSTSAYATIEDFPEPLRKGIAVSYTLDFTKDRLLDNDKINEYFPRMYS